MRIRRDGTSPVAEPTQSAVAATATVDARSNLIQELIKAVTSLPKFQEHQFLNPTQNFYDEDDRVLVDLFGTENFLQPNVRAFFQWRRASQSLTYALRDLFGKIAPDKFTPRKGEASAGPLAVLADGLFLINEQFPGLTAQLQGLDLRSINITSLMSSAASAGSKVSALSAMSFGVSAIKLYPLMKQYAQQLMSFAVAMKSPDIDAQARMFCAANLMIALGDTRLLRAFVSVYGFLPPHVSASTSAWTAKTLKEVFVDMKEPLIHFFGADAILEVFTILQDLFSMMSSSDGDYVNNVLKDFENNINFIN